MDAACELCVAGKYSEIVGSDAESNCLDCPSGTYARESALAHRDNCTKCLAGKYNPNNGSTDPNDCDDCAEGKYSGVLGRGTECSDLCPRGTFSVTKGLTRASECSNCSAGQYNSDEGQTSCQLCPVAKYYEGVRAEGESDCVSCPRGTFSVGVGLTNRSDCEACAPGTFAAQVNSTSCTACATATYSSHVGATSQSNCSSCPEGKFSEQRGLVREQDCEGCDVGKYNALTRQSVCTDCAEGKFNAGVNGTGEGVCSLCPMGMYNDQTGRSVCTACGANRYNPSLGSTVFSACIACAEGKFSSNTVQTFNDCRPCDQGTYPEDGECKPCHLNSDSAQGATSKSDCKCNPGYSQDSNGLCIVCPAGSYCPGAGLTLSCGLGQVSDPGSTSSDDCRCKDGFTPLPNGDCRGCGLGYYVANKECELCQENFYCPNGETQISCPRNSYSLRGAASRNGEFGHGCLCNAGFVRDRSDPNGQCQQCGEAVSCEAVSADLSYDVTFSGAELFGASVPASQIAEEILVISKVQGTGAQMAFFAQIGNDFDVKGSNAASGRRLLSGGNVLLNLDILQNLETVLTDAITNADVSLKEDVHVFMQFSTEFVYSQFSGLESCILNFENLKYNVLDLLISFHLESKYDKGAFVCNSPDSPTCTGPDSDKVFLNISIVAIPGRPNENKVTVEFSALKFSELIGPWTASDNDWLRSALDSVRFSSEFCDVGEGWDDTQTHTFVVNNGTLEDCRDSSSGECTDAAFKSFMRKYNVLLAPSCARCYDGRSCEQTIPPICKVPDNSADCFLITLQSPGQAANRVLVLPDGGGNVEFALAKSDVALSCANQNDANCQCTALQGDSTFRVNGSIALTTGTELPAPDTGQFVLGFDFTATSSDPNKVEALSETGSSWAAQLQSAVQAASLDVSAESPTVEATGISFSLQDEPSVDTQKAMITKLVSAEAETDLFLTGLGMAAAQYDLAVNVKTVKCEGNQRLFINGTSMTCVCNIYSIENRTCSAETPGRLCCERCEAGKYAEKHDGRGERCELCPENHYCLQQGAIQAKTRCMPDIVGNELVSIFGSTSHADCRSPLERFLTFELDLGRTISIAQAENEALFFDFAPKVRPAVSIAQGLVAADTGLTNISVNNFVTLWEIVPGANFSRALDIDSIREVMNAPRTTQVEIIGNCSAGHRCEARITTDILYNEAWQKTALEQQPGVEGVGLLTTLASCEAMIANASRTFALFDRALQEALGPVLNSIFGRVDAGGVKASHFLRMLPPDPNSRCRSESGEVFLRDTCQCPAHTVSDDGRCAPCGPGTYRAVDMAACTPCPEDHRCVGGQAPQNCSTVIAGSIAGLGSSVCRCPNMHYETHNGGHRCVACERKDPSHACELVDTFTELVLRYPAQFEDSLTVTAHAMLDTLQGHWCEGPSMQTDVYASTLLTGADTAALDAVQALRAEDFDAVSIQHAHALRVVYTIHGEQRLQAVFLSDFLETLLKQAAGQAKMLEPDRYVLQVGELHEMRFEVIFLYSLQGHNMSDIFSVHKQINSGSEDYLDDNNKRIKVQGRSYTLLSNITFHNRRPNAVISHDLQTKLSGVLRIDRVGIQQCVLVEGRVRGASTAPLQKQGFVLVNATTFYRDKPTCRAHDGSLGNRDENGDCVCDEWQERTGPDNNTFTCRKCPSGMYSEHGAPCQRCKEDHYCIDGAMHACPDFSFSSIGASSLQSCSCVGGFYPSVTADYRLSRCLDCAQAGTPTPQTCRLENKVFSVLQIPVVNYERIFYNASAEAWPGLGRLWAAFTSGVVDIVASVVNTTVHLAPNGVRIEYRVRFADGVTPTAESECQHCTRKFVGQYLELNATLADGACASDVTKCAQDVLQVLELEEPKIECDIGAHEGRALFFACLLNPSYLEETSSSNYVHRIQTVLGQEFPRRLQGVSAKFWLEYSYLSYEKARMEKLCLPWREQACDLSGIDMLVDMHTFDSAVVVQAAGLLNQAKTDFAGQVAAIDGIVYLSVGTARYGGRHITSCSQEIAGSIPVYGKCLCKEGEYAENGKCTFCPPNYWCSLNVKHACAQQVPSNVEIKWNSSDLCLCSPGFYQHGSACTRCRQGFYCPGVYEFGMQACPAAFPVSGMGAGGEGDCRAFDETSVLRVTLEISGAVDCTDTNAGTTLRAVDVKNELVQHYGAASGVVSSITHHVTMVFRAQSGSVTVDVANTEQKLKTSEFVNAAVQVDSFSVDGQFQDVHHPVQISQWASSEVEIVLAVSVYKKWQLDVCPEYQDMLDVMHSVLTGNDDLQAGAGLVVSHAEWTQGSSIFVAELEGPDLNTTIRNMQQGAPTPLIDSLPFTGSREEAYLLRLDNPKLASSACVEGASLEFGKCSCAPGTQCFPREHLVQGCSKSTDRKCIDVISDYARRRLANSSDSSGMFLASYISYAVLVAAVFLYFITMSYNFQFYAGEGQAVKKNL